MVRASCRHWRTPHRRRRLAGRPGPPSDIVTRTQAALSGKVLLDTAAGMIAATAGPAPGRRSGT